MRAVRGVVASTKRASLSEAASFTAAFVRATAAGEEARPDVALDELVRLHCEVDPHGGGEAENPSGGVDREVGDVGARVLGSKEARRMTKKKKKKRKREEFDRERSGFDRDLGDVRKNEKKKKKKEKEKR